MMYTSGDRRYKWKERVLVGLYLGFLLAIAGEFFYSLKIKTHTLEQAEITNHEQIPPHLPEETKLDLLRIPKLRWRHHN